MMECVFSITNILQLLRKNMLTCVTADTNKAPLGASMSVLKKNWGSITYLQPEFHFAIHIHYTVFFKRNHFVNLVPQPVSMSSTVHSPVSHCCAPCMGCAVWTMRTSCTGVLAFCHIRFFCSHQHVSIHTEYARNAAA